MDVIIVRAEEAVIALAGLLADEDTVAPVRRSVQRCAVWLDINLMTAVMAGAVIHLFKTGTVKVVDLAMLMPVVAGIGGIAGTQTMTLVIRGQATGQLGRGNLLWMLNREFIVGALNRLTWATVVAVGAVYFF